MASRPAAGTRRPGGAPRGACVALLAWLIVTVVTILPGLAAAQPLQAVPPLQARVTDLTGTLDASQRDRLEAELAAIEQRKGAQLAILIVPTTQPEAIEQYSIRVVEAWKLGRGRERAQRDTGNAGAGAIDDGVLLLVAKNDRKVRIEVGYGLEGAIPDAVAKRIISESISPRFRAGDFAGGLEAGVADLSRRIAGEDLPAPWQPAQGAEPEVSLLPAVFGAFLVGLFVSRVAGRLIGALVGGGGAGVTAAVGLASTGLGAAVGLGLGQRPRHHRRLWHPAVLLGPVLQGKMGGGGVCSVSCGGGAAALVFPCSSRVCL
ncbi:MAG: TPM domain-containing protein [Burkholderiales bacterium]